MWKLFCQLDVEDTLREEISLVRSGNIFNAFGFNIHSLASIGSLTSSGNDRIEDVDVFVIMLVLYRCKSLSWNRKAEQKASLFESKQKQFDNATKELFNQLGREIRKLAEIELPIGR